MRPNKREELVSKALTVFYQNGFHATGMDRLVAETGISKTSMYKHFRTKDELILAALRLRDERFRNWFMRRVEELAVAPRDRLLAVFDVLGEWINLDEFKGCMFIKASAEFQDRSHPIHVQSTEHKRLVYDYLSGIAAQAGARDPEQLACQLMILKEGAIVSAILNVGCDVVVQSKAAAKALIDQALASPPPTH
ncbi:TetR family transcriptional regulator [Aliisedimentitalea scapharcae]|uniref:TetR family transcriptional regulator n=1 Tax=Aliisedimentitalea scapharcae TaxID=1524259 RepID=A0ABZ2XYH2_9RHOB